MEIILFWVFLLTSFTMLSLVTRSIYNIYFSMGALSGLMIALNGYPVSVQALIFIATSSISIPLIFNNKEKSKS